MKPPVITPAREAATLWFEENPGAGSTVRQMRDATELNESAVYRAMRQMAMEGLLKTRIKRVPMSVGAAHQVIYTTTPKFVPRPVVRGLSIVQSALATRGPLLEAWWPIAANDDKRTAA